MPDINDYAAEFAAKLKADKDRQRKKLLLLLGRTDLENIVDDHTLRPWTWSRQQLEANALANWEDVRDVLQKTIDHLMR